MPTPRLFAAILALSFFAASVSAQTPAKPGDTKRLVLLHTNDQHGHLLPFSYPDRLSPKDDVAQMPVHKDVGGIARRATLVKQIRASEKNVLLFDSGDCMDGTPFSTEFFAQADYDAMNGVGYDFGVLGNHDFNMTAAQLKTLTGRAKYPVVVANVFHKGDKTTPLPPYVIKEWNGLKVAVFGLVTFDARTYAAAKEAFTMKRPLAVAKTLVPELRRKADFVILVSHIGLKEDQEIARAVPGIDIIVGGHSHTRLPKGVFQAADKPGPNDPKGTIILQAHQWGGELGRLDVTLTADAHGHWSIAKYAEQLIPVTKQYPDDPAVAATVASYWDRIKDKFTPVVGQAADDFSEVEGLDPTNYFLVCDLMRAELGSDFHLENFGGVRAPILKGPITLYNIVEVDPFDNTLYTFKIMGRDLLKVLVATHPATSATLRYELRESGKFSTGRAKYRLQSATLNGKPIAPDAVYTGSTSSYYFGTTLKSYAVDPVHTGKIRRTVLADGIRKAGTVTPTPDGRIKLNGADPYEAPTGK